MIKRLFMMSLLMICFVAVKSQDMIVTQANDTLKGTITQMTDKFMKIMTESKNEVIVNLNNVQSYEFDSSAPRDVKDLKKSNVGYSRFRIAVTGGFSYQTAIIGDGYGHEEEEYMRSLKKGFAFGGTFNYFFNRLIGIGFDYGGGFYKPKNAYAMHFVDDQNTSYYSDMSEKMIIQHFMPTFNLRAINRKSPNNYFLASFGIGYVHFIDKIFMTEPNTSYNHHFGPDIHVVTQTGGTVALLTRVGYDISVAKDMAIVLQMSLIGGVLNKVTETDEFTGKKYTTKYDGDGVGVGRLEFSVGFRFGR
ncbi:hypothetical protein LJB78_00075 [Bacteroidales bacterium OttesenSCG-928-J16]|nr:hypothetical protein [Bacteroidales bacterium OttesenSCG-928-J16]